MGEPSGVLAAAAFEERKEPLQLGQSDLVLRVFLCTLESEPQAAYAALEIQPDVFFQCAELFRTNGVASGSEASRTFSEFSHGTRTIGRSDPCALGLCATLTLEQRRDAARAFRAGRSTVANAAHELAQGV